MKAHQINKLLRVASIASLIILPYQAIAASQSSGGSYFSNALFISLLLIIIILLIVIVSMAGALKNLISSDFIIEKMKKAALNQKTKTAGLSVLFTFLSFSNHAQENVVAVANNEGVGGLDSLTLYTMLTVIGLELIALGILFGIFKKLLATETIKIQVAVKPKTKTILDKLNDTVEIEEEESILLDHDYDGIKELDNNLPPWWKYGFYLTILIAVIYMVNYHIAMTSPLQAQEYKNSIKKAEAEVAEYMKTSANNVDESTVKMLTDPSEINAGKDLFIAQCAACHGKGGEGTVGPNLTDEYWLHNGSVRDIFKTIKYGWPDKGMKAWKDDFSPIQIAQLTSFIKTLKGTNPPKPKEKQGELYIETVLTTDTVAKGDSTNVLTSQVIK